MKLLIFVKIPLFHYFKLQHDKNEMEGQMIDQKTKKKLCIQVKDEIIDHLE